MVCAVVVGPTCHEAMQQMEQVAKKAAWVELRMDAIEEVSNSRRNALLEMSSLPKILTFRRQQDGGKYTGDERERRRQMLQWAELIAGRKDIYMDLEEDLDEAFYQAIQTVLKGHQNLLLSHHQREKPLSRRELDTMLRSMQRRQARLYKIAVESKSCVDTLEFLDWAKAQLQRGVPLIAVSMGEAGELSRILSGVLGFPFTYGFFEEREGAFHQLVDLYRVPFHTSATGIYGLIGDPITGSIGHIAHNQFFRENELDAVYLKMRVREEELEDFFRYAAKLPLRGLSVTMPLKEKVVQYLDGMDSFVERSRAANTLVLQEGKWWGYNTDGEAIVEAISSRTALSRKKVLILGAGGSAKAAAWAMHRQGAFIDIMGRDYPKAHALAHSLQGKAWEWNTMDAWIDQDIIVNCTPVSFPTYPCLSLDRVLLLDLRIQSEEDPQLQVWQNMGGQVVHGKELFHRQARLQRGIWFG